VDVTLQPARNTFPQCTLPFITRDNIDLEIVNTLLQKGKAKVTLKKIKMSLTNLANQA